MQRRGRALVVLVLVGCSDREASQSPSGPPTIAPSTNSWGSAGDLVKVPGEIWYVATERSTDPPKLMRIAAGKREQIAESIVPHARLGDGRVIGVQTQNGKQQLVHVTFDGRANITSFGPTADAIDDVIVSGDAIVATVVDGNASSIMRVGIQNETAVKLAEGREPSQVDGGVAFVANDDIFVTELGIDRGPPGPPRPPRQLVDNAAKESAPRGNREGTAVLFGSDREGPMRIFVMRDGKQVRVTDRTDLQRDERSHVWSPDDRLIAYVIQRGTRRHVWIRDLEARSEIDVTPEGIHDDEPAFSPDSRWIVVSRTRGHDVDLWAIPVGVGEPVRLTTERFVDVHPRWF